MKEFWKNFYKTKYFHLILCLLLTGIAALLLLPYLSADRHSGHDIKYHFSIIRSLLIAWDEGNFNSKIMENIGGDYGYGTGLFYSTLPASVCVILMRVFHASFVGALYIELFLLFASSALVTYFFLLRVFRDGRVAAIGAFTYLCYPYFLWDVYVRFAFSEVFIMLAVPLIVWGVYELIHKNNPKAFLPLFVSGYVLSIFSHLTMTVYVTLFLIVWLLLEFKKTFRKQTILFFVLGTVIVLLISASFYIPMLDNYFVTDADSMSKTAEQIKVNSRKYFTETILTWDFSFSFCIAVTYVLWYAFRGRGKRTAATTCLLIVSLLIPFMYSHFFPWKIMPNFLRMIQYTFRLLILSGITTSLALGIMLQDVFFRVKKQPETSLSEATESTDTVEEETPVVTEETQEKKTKRTVFPKGKKQILRWISNIASIVVLSCSMVYCVYVGYQHNSAMPKSLFNNAGSTTFDSDGVEELTGYSEFEGLGTNKHGDYFPKNCNRTYVYTRLRSTLIGGGNLSVSELGAYAGLEQVSFLASKTENSAYTLLNVPYEAFEGVEVYRYTTNKDNKQLSITAESASEGAKVRLTMDKYGKDSKIILSYKNAPKFKQWLQETAFGVLTLEGDVAASELVREKAGKYSVNVTVSKGCGVIELPSFYYKGYELKFVTEEGYSYAIEPTHGRNGFIEATLDYSGTLYVEYDSAAETVSYVLSGFGWAALLGAIVCMALPSGTFSKLIKRKDRETEE
ncbi:MAG: hypothetical protein IJV85_00355 [Clostridia bacterium]|nr:hypothetical protein [Clostridia bacterium]